MTNKTKMIFWYVGLAVIVASLSYVAYRLDHPTTAILVIVVPAVLIANGFLAEVEDYAPGGFLSEKKADGTDEDKNKAK